MKLLSQLAGLWLISLFAFNLQAAEVGKPEQGNHYKVVNPAGSSDKPLVLEFFNYGCGACYSMEAFIADWKTKKPESIEFQYVPVDLNPQWAVYTRAYYLGELLNVFEKSHKALFSRIHTDKKPIKDDSELKAFFVSLGVSEADFDKANSSFALDARLRQSAQMARKFRIASTPTFVINNKFVTDGRSAKSYEMLEQVLTQVPVETAN